MQTATGRIRYNPTIPGLPRNGDWLILECDDDWHRMYAAEAEARLPGRWMLAVDADRYFTSEYAGRPQQPLIRQHEKYGVFTERQVRTPHELPRTFVDYTPHLALFRPRFERPVWGVHISVVRGESPRIHRATWDQQVRRRGSRGCPPEFVEGAEVEFEFDPTLELFGTHWCLRVRCPQVPAIRRFYGLTDYSKVPLHLTVGVTEG